MQEKRKNRLRRSIQVSKSYDGKMMWLLYRIQLFITLACLAFSLYAEKPHFITFHSRSIINYGLIAPWIFIGSSSIVIGVCLVVVKKRKQFAAESKGVSEKSAAKQREIRHTVFMDKKGVDTFPGYRSKQTMLSKDQVWLLFFLLLILPIYSNPSRLFAFDSS